MPCGNLEGLIFPLMSMWFMKFLVNTFIRSGVVSRIDMKRYGSGAGKLLCVQIDAAINPGNSGGPAFNDGTPEVGLKKYNNIYSDTD